MARTYARDKNGRFAAAGGGTARGGPRLPNKGRPAKRLNEQIAHANMVWKGSAGGNKATTSAAGKLVRSVAEKASAFKKRRGSGKAPIRIKRVS